MKYTICLILAFFISIFHQSSSPSARNIVSEGNILIETLDLKSHYGRIIEWTPGNNTSRELVSYNQRVGDSNGWGNIAFSDDGEYVAYARVQDGKWLVGISKSIIWNPTELELNSPVTFEQIQLKWFPLSKYLTISYIIDDELSVPKQFNKVVYRQILDIYSFTKSLQLQNWPYVCYSIAVNKKKQVSLYCQGIDLANKGLKYSSVLYVFKDRAFDYSDGSPQIIFKGINDILNPNWAWSDIHGLAWLALPDASSICKICLLQDGKELPTNISLDREVSERVKWSMESSRLLLKGSISKTWYVFDVSTNSIIYTLQNESLEMNVEPIWFRNEQTLAYVNNQIDSQVVTIVSFLDKAKFVFVTITDPEQIEQLTNFHQYGSS